MPRYYCDYCDTYLTHDSPSVRKQHNAGYKHKGNVRSYYQHFEEQQTQILIDKRIKEHLWQAAPFQHQVGATFNQHLISLQSNQQRPCLPVLVPPNLPVGASSQAPVPSPFLSGVRPPVLPHLAVGFPGYGAFPSGQPSGAPPGAPPMPMQMNSLPRPPTLTPATWAAAPPTSSSAATLFSPAMYQANSSSAAMIGAFNPPTAPGFQTAAPAAATDAASTASQDGVSYAPASETNR